MTSTETPSPQDPEKDPPAKPAESEDQDFGSDHHMRVLGKMVGTAFMFLGFLQIFLSISGGFELSGVVALLLYFGGLAIWANAVIEQPLLRWGVTIGAIALALGFLQFGEILFWHKQTVFWFTVVIVMYFMFKEPKKPAA
jgi:predicted MFS family arabinose efflux permease